MTKISIVVLQKQSSSSRIISHQAVSKAHIVSFTTYQKKSTMVTFVTNSYQNHAGFQALAARVKGGEVSLLHENVPSVWAAVPELQKLDLRSQGFYKTLQKRLRSLRQEMGVEATPSKRPAKRTRAVVEEDDGEKPNTNVWDAVQELQSFNIDNPSLRRALQRNLKALRQEMGVEAATQGRGQSARKRSRVAEHEEEASNGTFTRAPRAKHESSTPNPEVFLNDPSFDYSLLADDDLQKMKKSIDRPSDEREEVDRVGRLQRADAYITLYLRVKMAQRARAASPATIPAQTAAAAPSSGFATAAQSSLTSVASRHNGNEPPAQSLREIVSNPFFDYTQLTDLQMEEMAGKIVETKRQEMEELEARHNERISMYGEIALKRALANAAARQQGSTELPLHEDLD